MIKLFTEDGWTFEIENDTLYLTTDHGNQFLVYDCPTMLERGSKVMIPIIKGVDGAIKYSREYGIYVIDTEATGYIGMELVRVDKLCGNRNITTPPNALVSFKWKNDNMLFHISVIYK